MNGVGEPVKTWLHYLQWEDWNFEEIRGVEHYLSERDPLFERLDLALSPRSDEVRMGIEFVVSFFPECPCSGPFSSCVGVLDIVSDESLIEVLVKEIWVGSEWWRIGQDAGREEALSLLGTVFREHARAGLDKYRNDLLNDRLLSAAIAVEKLTKEPKSRGWIADEISEHLDGELVESFNGYNLTKIAELLEWKLAGDETWASR